MKHKPSMLIVALLAAVAVLCTGCSQKFFKPETHFILTGVEPHQIFPATDENISETNTVGISFKASNSVPVMLKSFSIKYTTGQGQHLKTADIIEMPYIQEVGVGEAGAEGPVFTLNIHPYTAPIIYAFSSQSDISPIKAEITINFEDTNGNHPSLTTYCFLHKPAKMTSPTTEPEPETAPEPEPEPETGQP